MVPHGPVMSHMVLYGPVWSIMFLFGPYGLVWSHKALYGPIWPRTECGPVCFLMVIMFAFVQLTQLLHKFCAC